MANQPTPRTVQAPPDLPAMPDVSTTLSGYLRNFSLWCRHGFADKLSGTVAQPGLMLQGYDAAAGVNPAIYMLEVSQAGVAALAPMALGGGAMGAPVPIASRKGVTDGSSAAAGDIGEVISAINTVGTPVSTTNVGVNVASISLPPGDWDVQGDVFIATTASLVSAHGGINNVSAAIPGVALNASRQSINVAGMANTMLSLKACRALVTVTTVYYLIAQAGFTSGSCTATGVIWARRAH